MKSGRLKKEEENSWSTFSINERETNLTGGSREERKLSASSSLSPAASSTSRRSRSASGRVCKGGEGGRGPRSFVSTDYCQDNNSTLHARGTTLCRAADATFIFSGGKTTDTAKKNGTNQWERADNSDTEGKDYNPGSEMGLADQDPALITKRQYQQPTRTTAIILKRS
jgi:hypothetical protein